MGPRHRAAWVRLSRVPVAPLGVDHVDRLVSLRVRIFSYGYLSRAECNRLIAALEHVEDDEKTLEKLKAVQCVGLAEEVADALRRIQKKKLDVWCTWG